MAPGRVVAGLRTVVPGVGPDRWLAPELAAAEEWLRAAGPVESAGVTLA